MREMVPKMKGGAVREERSPLNEAIDYSEILINSMRLKMMMQVLTFRKVAHEPLFWGAMPAPSSLEEPDMAFRRKKLRRR